MRGAHRQLSHMRGILMKFPDPDIFDRQRPHLGRACHAFVITAGDQGVLLPDPAVQAHQPAREKADQQRRRRHQKQDRQSQAGTDQQHDRRRTHEIGRTPHKDHQFPADHLPDLGGVTHGTGQHITDTVMIEIAKRQRLDMVKGTLRNPYLGISQIIPTFDQYPTFCNTPYTVKIEITKRLGLVLMVKGRKLLLMYRQDLSILALLFCLHRFV